MEEIVQPAGDTWTIGATVSTCGPWWDVLRAMDLSKPGDLIDIRCSQVEEVTRLRIRPGASRLVNSRIWTSRAVSPTWSFERQR